MKFYYVLSYLAVLGLMSTSYAANPHHAIRHHMIRQAVKIDQKTININAADEKQLATIKGIGPKRAKAIVNYRVAHGNFKTIDGLSRVKGIGPNRLKEMRDHLTV